MDNPKDTPMDYKQFEGHTPGPWKSNAMYSRVVNDDDDVEICEVAVNHKNEAFSYNEWRANSRLLASAPDLLKENAKLRFETGEQKEALAYWDKLSAAQVNEIDRLKLELQKQKELNAELVRSLTSIQEKWASGDHSWSGSNDLAESLIKKSSEI